MFKALIVDAGGMGKAWGRNLRDHADQVEVVGWVDIRPDAAEQAAAELQVTGATTRDDLGVTAGFFMP